MVLWDGHPLPLVLLSTGAGALARARAITIHFDTAKPVNTAFYLSTTTTTKQQKNLLYIDIEQTNSLEF